MIRSVSGRWFMIQEGLATAVSKRVLAYGAGLVGGWVCSELPGRITVVDRDQSVLDGLSGQREDDKLALVCADALEHARTTDLSRYSLILNMLPGRIGGKLRERLISSGTSVVDIAFAEDIPPEWHEVARAAGTTFVHDVGIAPGLSNMLIAAASKEMGSLTKATIRVGGNPAEPDDDWSDDEDPWGLGSFCFFEEEDFGIMFGGVVFNAENEDSFDEEFQDEWE